MRQQGSFGDHDHPSFLLDLSRAPIQVVLASPPVSNALLAWLLAAYWRSSQTISNWKLLRLASVACCEARRCSLIVCVFQGCLRQQGSFTGNVHPSLLPLVRILVRSTWRSNALLASCRTSAFLGLPNPFWLFLTISGHSESMRVHRWRSLTLCVALPMRCLASCVLAFLALVLEAPQIERAQVARLASCSESGAL